MSILVCGGAGYVGSITVKSLMEKGYEVVVLDNLSTGHREAVTPGAILEVADVRDEKALERIFMRHDIDCVMHFCAEALIAESLEKPLEYFNNNVTGTLTLLQAVVDNDVGQFIYSSTAATYGEPAVSPITEETPTHPTSAYGETCLGVERMLPWMEQAYGLKYKVFRYFNAAGGAAGGELGEDHLPETHLLPLLIKAAMGQKDKIYIFGDDYPTPDGSGIRDYVHVEDIAAAHILAMEDLERGGESDLYNLGCGQGHTVKEVIAMVEAVTGHKIAVEPAPRRPGDSAVLVASAAKAREQLGWDPQYSDLETIIRSAWAFHCKYPEGY